MKTYRKLLPLIGISLALASSPSKTSAAITGQWGFAAGDLFKSAIIGLPIESLTLETDQATRFGTTGQGAFASVPHINGTPVKIMKFPKTPADGGYYVPHGAGPNGGGVLINQYTIILDVLYSSASSGKRRALFQTDAALDPSNPNAEFFVNNGNQVGTDGRDFGGNLTPDTWHRVAIVADLAAVPPVIDKYVDGVKVSSGNPGPGLDGRFAINVLYFDNDDNDETEEGYLSSLQFRDEAMAEPLIAALGGATPDGILTGPPPNPYVTSLIPSPESARIPERSTVSPQPLIEAQIEDGVSTVDTTMVITKLDGAPVPSIASKTGTTTTINYAPAGFLASLSKHTVLINYKDNHGASYTVSWDFVVGRYQSLDAAAAGAAGSANTPGFLVRTAQAPSDAGILNLNSLGRAIQQLNGTLTDANGVVVPNVAFLGGNADGSYDIDLINFHLNGASFGVFMDDAMFSGIPGSDDGKENFAADVITFLDLPAGLHKIGVSASTARTDSGTDDGYAWFSGRDPRNILSPVVGSFFRGSVPAFSDSFTTNEITVVAPVAGIYPIRLVYWQVSNDASLEFYTVDESTGEKILVNDANDSRSVPAYRFSATPFANRPYLAEISPRSGAQGISSSQPIEALLIDDQTAVDTGSIQLSLNGKAVTPAVNKSNGRTAVSYLPNATRPDVTNIVRLVYKDNAKPTPKSFTNDWSFTISVSLVGESNVAGQWDFDQCDLSATLGKPLQYFDGPAGKTFTKTVFGTTTALGIADINGEPAKVMQVPGDLDRNIGYIMDHGIAPNGGGTRVNQYTLVMDIMVDTSGPGAASLIQTSSLNNTDDGDLFWQGNNFGQGTGGYNGTGAFTAGAWHRIAIAYDEAAHPPVATKYVDGIKQDDWTANQALDKDRRTLLPTAILFGDGDQDERRVMWVNSIQIRSGKLSDAELTALGGPSASGIPVAIVAPPAPPEARLSINRSGNQLRLSWPAGVTGYRLECTPSLANPTWQTVPSVSNCATVPLNSPRQFYRLVNP